jgi:four helix bundle protein
VQRAAVSTMTNIAEGFERVHLAEKLQFYNVARASCGEVRSLSYILSDCGYATTDEVGQIKEFSIKTGKILTGLIRATKDRKN